MPTFLIGGFKMRFYSNDHEPAHVHCINGDGIVVINIATGIVRKRVGGIREPDVVRAVHLVEEHRDRLLREWVTFQLLKST
jgi:hypothetical protein